MPARAPAPPPWDSPLPACPPACPTQFGGGGPADGPDAAARDEAGPMGPALRLDSKVQGRVPSARLRRAQPRRGRSPACLCRMASGGWAGGRSGGASRGSARAGTLGRDGGLLSPGSASGGRREDGQTIHITSNCLHVHKHFESMSTCMFTSVTIHITSNCLHVHKHFERQFILRVIACPSVTFMFTSVTCMFEF